MGATGERPDIGLVTEAQARYLCTDDNMALAVVCAILSTWLGLATGDWLKRVRR